MEIKTERLILRRWRLDDVPPFAALNADPRVMEFFPSSRSYEDSVGEYTRITAAIEKNGWGLWAAELAMNGAFIGFIGLRDVDAIFPFAPSVEIGWRLAHEYWGRGYATEGARAALQYGFHALDLPEIVSYTTERNRRSRHVMEKIGMQHNAADDFDHPLVSKEHPLIRHVLYRLSKTVYEEI